MKPSPRFVQLYPWRIGERVKSIKKNVDLKLVSTQWWHWISLFVAQDINECGKSWPKLEHCLSRVVFGVNIGVVVYGRLAVAVKVLNCFLETVRLTLAFQVPVALIPCGHTSGLGEFISLILMTSLGVRPDPIFRTGVIVVGVMEQLEKQNCAN